MVLLQKDKGVSNKAGYMAQDAPSTRLREGVTDGRSYIDAAVDLKRRRFAYYMFNQRRSG